MAGLKNLAICLLCRKAIPESSRSDDWLPSSNYNSEQQAIPPNGDWIRRVYYINLLYVVESGGAGDAEARERPSENAKKEKSGLTIGFCDKIFVKAC